MVTRFNPTFQFLSISVGTELSNFQGHLIELCNAQTFAGLIGRSLFFVPRVSLVRDASVTKIVDESMMTGQLMILEPDFRKS